jgi:hypothetical protein
MRITLSNLHDMGFEKEQIDLALIASNGDINAAFQILQDSTCAQNVVAVDEIDYNKLVSDDGIVTNAQNIPYEIPHNNGLTPFQVRLYHSRLFRCIAYLPMAPRERVGQYFKYFIICLVAIILAIALVIFLMRFL